MRHYYSESERLRWRRRRRREKRLGNERGGEGDIENGFFPSSFFRLFLRTFVHGTRQKREGNFFLVGREVSRNFDVGRYFFIPQGKGEERRKRRSRYNNRRRRSANNEGDKIG